MATGKKAKEEAEIAARFARSAKTIIDTPINDEVSKSFMEYSLSVVFSRALVSATDGLKPVARRILFSMYRDGHTHDKNYVKSAKSVGAVMGNLHPHGDSSIYDAMVKLAQPWYTNVKYIDGYGNWGDAGGSGAAASRYTESRLDKNALLMISEIKENTVNMKPNYDGEDEEPVVLPVQFPALVINGTFGLAVGFASNMAPHNPTEVLDATRWLLTHPNADLDKLMTFIPGPDFPTGGQIIGSDAIRSAYENGKGVIRIRATYHVEALGRGKHDIIFTEMPYGVKMETILTKIKDGIKNQKLLGIADAKDLTDRRNGIRLVVETKAGVNPEALVLDLFKNTPLEDSFGINNVALVREENDGKMVDIPKTLGLKEQLEIFLAHRIDVVTRRSQHRKDKRDARLHILEGMLKALANIDEVIRIIRAAVNSSEAQEGLIKKFKIDEIQADYILSIPLRRLTKFDQIELDEEKIKLTGEVKELDKILNDESVLRSIIADELSEVRKQLDRPRRSVLVDGSLAEHLAEVKKVTANASVEIADEPCFISLSKNGAVLRNAKPVRNAVAVAASTTRGKFMVVTSKGRGFRLESLHVGEKASPLEKLLPSALESGERILTVTPLALEEGKVGGIVMGTKMGTVKVQDPKGYPKNGEEFNVIGLIEGDELLNARWVDDQDAYDFVFINSNSNMLRTNVSVLRPQGSLSATGVAGFKFDASTDEILDFNVVSHEEIENGALVVSVSDGGTAKFTPLKNYPVKGRGGIGVRTLKFLKGENKVAFSTIAVGTPDLTTADGTALEALPVDERRDGSGKPLGGIPVR